MSKELRIFHLNEIIEERIFLFLCAGIAASIPFGTVLNSILCILLLTFWLFFQKKEFNLRLLKIRLAILLSGLFLLALIGLLHTENMEEGLFRIQQKTALILFPLVFGSISINYEKLISIVSSSFIAAVFVACIVCLLNAVIVFIQLNETAQFFGHDLASVLNIYPYLLAFCCLVAIMLIQEKIQNKFSVNQGRYMKIVLVFLLFFFSLFIFLLSIRQVIICWVILAITFLFHFSTNKKIIFGAMVSFIVITLLSVVYIPTLNQKTMDLFNKRENNIPLDSDASLGRSWNGIAIRKAIWRSSASVVKENFWLGTGTGDAQDQLQQAYEKRKFYFASRYNKYNAHNQYLQSLITHGLFGLVILMSSLIVPAFYLRGDITYMVFAISILSIFITESMLETNKGIIIFSLFNSLLVFGKLEKNKSVPFIKKTDQ